MSAVGAWAKRQVYVYFDNAASKRDFRVQLRGSRAILLWTIYLLVFAVIAATAYQSIGSVNQTVSLAAAQQQLHTFYLTTLTVLGGLVSLIAPALGASAIVTERQRRSLDLVFSAPVTAKYYLVGKLISAYRYIWMLMILSLPIVSVGAVMGGATWSDVLLSFLIISLDGLLFASIALAISAGADRLPAALSFSYLAAIGVIIGSSIFAAVGAAGTLTGRTGKDAPVTGLLSPFGISYLDSTTSNVFGHEIPNWLLFVPLVLSLVFLLLLGGGSALASRHVRESALFRILGLVFIAVLSCYIMSVEEAVPSGFVGRLSSRPPGTGNAGTVFAAAMLIFLLAVPLATCYKQGDPKKFEFDGPPKLKNLFRAVPSGSLPYIISIPIAGFLGAALELALNGNLRELSSLASYLVWAEGLFLVMWSVSRFTPRVTGTLSASRALAVVFLALFFAVPAIIAGEMNSAFGGETSIPISPWSVLTNPDKPALAIQWGLSLTLLATIIALLGARFRKNRWTY